MSEQLSTKAVDEKSFDPDAAARARKERELATVKPNSLVFSAEYPLAPGVDRKALALALQLEAQSRGATAAGEVDGSYTREMLLAVLERMQLPNGKIEGGDYQI